jgi:hypothetical protein
MKLMAESTVKKRSSNKKKYDAYIIGEVHPI